MQNDFLAQIERVLRANGLWFPGIEQRVEEFNRLCLAQLRDDLLREVVTAFLLERVPTSFYVAPASSSGKNHPSWQSNVGGILLNTVECCIAIDRKMRIYPELTDSTYTPLSLERDVIYAATILSDTFKPEDYGKTQWSEWRHHERAAAEFEQFASSKGLETAWIQPVKDAIFWHLGRFTPNREKEMLNPRVTLTTTSFVTHELDMDFSNGSLDEVFLRKGTSNEQKFSDLPSNFVLQELSSITTVSFCTLV